jgi:hypothetical protein
MAMDRDETNFHQRTNHILEKKQAETTEDLNDNICIANHVLLLLQKPTVTIDYII